MPITISHQPAASAVGAAAYVAGAGQRQERDQARLMDYAMAQDRMRMQRQGMREDRRRFDIENQQSQQRFYDQMANENFQREQNMGFQLAQQGQAQQARERLQQMGAEARMQEVEFMQMQKRRQMGEAAVAQGMAARTPEQEMRLSKLRNELGRLSTNKNLDPRQKAQLRRDLQMGIDEILANPVWQSQDQKPPTLQEQFKMEMVNQGGQLWAKNKDGEWYLPTGQTKTQELQLKQQEMFLKYKESEAKDVMARRGRMQDDFRASKNALQDKRNSIMDQIDQKVFEEMDRTEYTTDADGNEVKVEKNEAEIRQKYEKRYARQLMDVYEDEQKLEGEMQKSMEEFNRSQQQQPPMGQWQPAGPGDKQIPPERMQGGQQQQQAPQGRQRQLEALKSYVQADPSLRDRATSTMELADRLRQEAAQNPQITQDPGFQRKVQALNESMQYMDRKVNEGKQERAQAQQMATEVKNEIKSIKGGIPKPEKFRQDVVRMVDALKDYPGMTREGLEKATGRVQGLAMKAMQIQRGEIKDPQQIRQFKDDLGKFKETMKNVEEISKLNDRILKMADERIPKVKNMTEAMNLDPEEHPYFIGPDGLRYKTKADPAVDVPMPESGLEERTRGISRTQGDGPNLYQGNASNPNDYSQEQKLALLNAMLQGRR